MACNSDGLLWYDICEGVKAFSTMRDAVLPYRVITGHQVHGTKVAKVDNPALTRESLEGYDALITNLRGCAIGVRTADCIPILLYDPVRRAAGAVHSGWKGTVGKILLSTMAAMAAEYGTDTENLHAVIGPGISLAGFQVGTEVVQIFRDAGFPMDIICEYQGKPQAGTMAGGYHIDLIRSNRWLLESAGVRPDNIGCAGICTYQDKRFFSARREGQSCGRIINAVRID